MLVWEETLNDYWKDKLVKFDESALAELNIGQHAKDVLQRVGLPEIAIGGSLLFQVAPEPEPMEFDGERYVVIGNNVGDDSLGIYVAIRESSGEIYQLHTRYDKASFFMNSDLRSFLLYLYEYAEFVLGTRDLPEDEFWESKETMGNALKEKFLAIDPEALAKSNHYWVLILAEYEIYL